MEKPEMYFASWWNNPTYLSWKSKLSHLEVGGIGSRTESCVKWGGDIAMVAFCTKAIFIPKGSYGYG